MDLVTPRWWLLNSSPLLALQALAYYGPGAIAGGLALGGWLALVRLATWPSLYAYLAIAVFAGWTAAVVGVIRLIVRARNSQKRE